MNGGLFMQILKENVRTNILSEAKKAFLEKGFEKASMRQIATSSGITVGNVYRYFKNKDELFSAVVKEAQEAILQIIVVNHSSKLDYHRMIDENPDDYIFIDPVLNEIISVFIKFRSEINILMKKSGGSKFENIPCDFKTMVVNKIYTEIFEEIESEVIDFKMFSESLANTCIDGVVRVCNSDMSDAEVHKNIYGLMFYLFQGAHKRIKLMEQGLEGEEYEKK